MRRVKAEHGIVCRKEGMFGYFSWPSVTRTDDGKLLVIASGHRIAHLCPFGKSMLLMSHDEGKTWSEPIIVGDTLIDDRDSGIVNLGGSKLLATWFSYDERISEKSYIQTMNAEEHAVATGYCASLSDEDYDNYLGSYVRRSLDGGLTWTPRDRVPVTAPHGPIKLRNGKLLYLGKEYRGRHHNLDGNVMSYTSSDEGATWVFTGVVPLPDGANPACFNEPHVVELPSGRLLGMVRYQHMEPYTNESLSFFSTCSDDAGKTWSTAVPTGVEGTPPHLIRHSSGALICVYGRRIYPFGEMVMISYDDGETWETDIVIRDDGSDWDLGYPCSTELPDGSIFTVYYQKLANEKKCSILWSRWLLPDCL